MSACYEECGRNFGCRATRSLSVLGGLLRKRWRLDRLFVCGLLVLISVAAANAQQFSPSLYQDMHWRMIGPFRGGRTVAISGVPGAPNLFYMAANNGGVWKTTDFGQTWQAIFDDQPTGSIGALAVAPSQPDTSMWAAARVFVALTFLPATEFIRARMRARPGSISGCEMRSRSAPSSLTPRTRIGFLSLPLDTRTVLMKNAASFAHWMAG